jgi:hypothetical protein
MERTLAPIGKCARAAAILAALVSGDENGPPGRPALPPSAKGGTLPLPSSTEIQPGYEDDNATPLVYSPTRHAIGGVALRNCRMGGIQLVGVPAGSTVVKAFLYWAITSTYSSFPGVHDVIHLQRLCPVSTAKAKKLQGRMVGVGYDPNWLGGFCFVYRADVTKQSPLLVTGGGTYLVSLPPFPVVGSGDYSDPHGPPGPVPPLAEGASLVVVYTNGTEPMGTTHLYDVAFAGGNHNLSSPQPVGFTFGGFAPATAEARFSMSAADGESGKTGYRQHLDLGYHDIGFDAALAGGNVFGAQIAGGTAYIGLPSLYNDSDLAGSAGRPLPQLWDVTTHDVSPYVVGSPWFAATYLNPMIDLIYYDECVFVNAVMWTR